MNKPTAQPSYSSDPALGHSEANALLYRYAHAHLSGDSPAEIYPAIAAHLALCERCRADLEELYVVVQEAADPDGPKVVPVPGPNVQRLPRPWRHEATDARPWFTDRLGRMWLEFSTDLLQSWEPEPLFGMARGETLYSYVAPMMSDEPAMDIEIASNDDDATVQVSITVSIPTRPTLDQSGIAVTLHLAGATHTDTTDASGCVEFPGIPRTALDQLRLEITCTVS